MLALVTFCIASQIICSSSAVINDLPSYFPRCNVDDPEISKCIVKASEELREHMKKGVPELDIPQLEPLVVPEIRTEQGTDAVNYKIILKNAKISGLGDYKFSEFTFDPKTLSFHGKAEFEKMSLESDYEIDGKILLAPIQGKGFTRASLSNSTGALSVKGELVKRNGDEYYQPKEVKATIVIGDIDSSFEGLFGGNEQLATATRQLLKEHSNEIIKEVTPAIEKVAEELTLKIMSGINKHVPYKKLLPPSH